MNADDWIGKVGETWATEWQRTDRSFAALDDALERAILRAMPEGPVRLVDLGCGAGTTSLAIAAARPAAHVVGLDLSADLVAVATARAVEHGLGDRCRFVAGDAPALAAEEAPVDGFFSRHGVMFFADPVVAFARLAAAAAPGAPIVFSCFAAVADNPWATETAPPLAAPPPAAPPATPEPGPFAFADPARVAAILDAAGWRAGEPERIGYRYVAGADGDPVGDAVGFFRRIGPAARALRDAGAGERPALLDRLRRACAARLDGGEVAFAASAWLWTATRKETAR